MEILKKMFEILIAILAAFGAALGLYKLAENSGAEKEKLKRAKQDLEKDRKFFTNAIKENEKSSKMSRDELVADIMQPRD